MSLLAETRLMKNQKLAKGLNPDKAFNVVQTPEGDSLFFSISNNGKFFVTREMPGTETGWSQVCLSSSITTTPLGEVKSFALSQHPLTGKVDIALVVTAAGSDKLYVRSGLPSKSYEWDENFAWNPIPFDASGIVPSTPLMISNVYLMEFNTGVAPGTSNPSFFVDIVRNPAKPMGLLDRYYILLGSSTSKWNKQALPVEFEAGSTSSCMGYRASDRCPGVYTYGAIESTTQLIYTPQRNPFRPDVAVNPARFSLPPGISRIASCANVQGETILFATSNIGLYAYGIGLQQDRAQPQLVVPALSSNGTSLFESVTFMQAVTVQKKTVVWLLNGDKDLFYVTCPAQQELNASSWSTPIPFCSAVDNFAFYLDKKHGSDIAMFANISGRKILDFRQDDFSQWTQRNILLPSTSVNDYVEFESFTTTITYVGSNNVQEPKFSVNLTADSPISVYINNTYQLLSPDVPIVATADPAGLITIIQETEAIASVNYTAALTSDTSCKVTSDSSQHIVKRLASIGSSGDLLKVRVTDDSGVEKPLVPASARPDQVDAVSAAISQLLYVRGALLSSTATATTITATVTTSHELAADSSLFQVGKVPPSASPPSNSILLAVGDLVAFVTRGWHGLQSIAIQAVEGAWQMVVTIGSVVYRAVLNTINAVMGAVQCVLQTIKVTFKDLVAWLGFVFDWDDILRTAQVLEADLQARTKSLVDSVDLLQSSMPTVFGNMKAAISSWGNITDPEQTIGTMVQQAHAPPGTSKLLPQLSDPQCSWGTYHLLNAMSSAAAVGFSTNDASSPKISSSLVADLTAITLDLEKQMHETNSADSMAQQIQKQIIDQWQQLTAVEVVTKFIAICGSKLLDITEAAAVKVLEIAKVVLAGLVQSLDAVIELPILSAFYKKIAGQPLTAVRLVSLVAAIPSTITYKILFHTSPVPNQAAVQALNAALDRRLAKATEQMAMLPTLHLPSGDKKVSGAAGNILPVSSARQLSSQDINWDAVRITLFYLAGAAGGFAVACRGHTRWEIEEGINETHSLTKCRQAVSCLAYTLYLAPNWYAWENAEVPWISLNLACAVMSGLKYFIDQCWTTNSMYNAFSPCFDLGLSATWMYPAGRAWGTSSPRQAEDHLMLAANVVAGLASIPGLVVAVPDDAGQPAVGAYRDRLTRGEAHKLQFCMQVVAAALVGSSGIAYGVHHI